MKKLKDLWFILVSMLKAKEWLFMAKKDNKDWFYAIEMSDATADEAERLYEELKYED